MARLSTRKTQGLNSLTKFWKLWSGKQGLVLYCSLYRWESFQEAIPQASILIVNMLFSWWYSNCIAESEEWQWNGETVQIAVDIDIVIAETAEEQVDWVNEARDSEEGHSEVLMWRHRLGLRLKGWKFRQCGRWLQPVREVHNAASGRPIPTDWLRTGQLIEDMPGFLHEVQTE